jgi:hypothetical protein
MTLWVGDRPIAKPPHIQDTTTQKDVGIHLPQAISDPREVQDHRALDRTAAGTGHRI